MRGRARSGEVGRTRKLAQRDLPDRVQDHDDVGIEVVDIARPPRLPVVAPVALLVGPVARDAREVAPEAAVLPRFVAHDGATRLARPQFETATERDADRVTDDQHAERAIGFEGAMERRGRRSRGGRASPRPGRSPRCAAGGRASTGVSRRAVRARRRGAGAMRSPRSTPTTRTHATAGVSTRGQTFRKRAPRRIGSSTKWNDANASASVVASRSASNGANDSPVRSGDSHRKIGQWNR